MCGSWRIGQAVNNDVLEHILLAMDLGEITKGKAGAGWAAEIPAFKDFLPYE